MAVSATIQNSRGATLNRSRNSAAEQPSKAIGPKKSDKIDSTEGTMMAAAAFMFVDVPAGALKYFIITYLFGIMWNFVGWLAVLLWLWQKDYGIFKIDKKKNLIFAFLSANTASAIGLPGLSGFIIYLIIKQRSASLIPGKF
jgi:hypothetical protein